MVPAGRIPAGGSFIVEDATDALTPEDLGEDRAAIKAAADDFARKEVAPNVLKMEGHDHAELLRLFRQAGDLGFLGIEIPEAYGGLGLDLVTSALAFEAVAGTGSGSFAVTYGAHTGIGVWPILYFGTDEQRSKYLPKIASGEWVAAYALTEPGSGSDALAAKTTARLSPDGRHWIVNGSKTFITNAAFADVFTVFLKIDGQNACLIVEKGTPGFTVEKEEEKLGIRGSSTCGLSFDEALVPAENLLGLVGKGHKVVLNTLNLGRFKLGAAAVGAIKSATTGTVEYAAGRRQFGRPILDFDAVRQKVAEMAILGWVGESMVCRAAGLLNANLEGQQPGEAAAKAIEEYTVECSLVKVALSEMLWTAVNHGVQAFGGYGYVMEYPAARALADARVNMIFEGTNEINRMLAVDALTRQAMKGKVDLFGAFSALGAWDPGTDPARGTLRGALGGLKRSTLFVLGEAVQKHMQGLKDEQQILLGLADLLIGVYAAESAILRLEALARSSAPAALQEAAARVYCNEWQLSSQRTCAAILGALFEGQERLEKIARCSALLGAPLYDDVIALKKAIAAAAAAKGGYPF